MSEANDVRNIGLNEHFCIMYTGTSRCLVFDESPVLLKEQNVRGTSSTDHSGYSKPQRKILWRVDDMTFPARKREELWNTLRCQAVA